MIHSQLSKTVIYFHIQGLFKLSALKADQGADSGFQSHTSCSREETLCKRQSASLLSIISWSSTEVRAVDQIVNYDTMTIIVTVELFYTFIDIIKPNGKEK